MFRKTLKGLFKVFLSALGLKIELDHSGMCVDIYQVYRCQQQTDRLISDGSLIRCAQLA